MYLEEAFWHEQPNCKQEYVSGFNGIFLHCTICNIFLEGIFFTSSYFLFIFGVIEGKNSEGISLFCPEGAEGGGGGGKILIGSNLDRDLYLSCAIRMSHPHARSPGRSRRSFHAFF